MKKSYKELELKGKGYKKKLDDLQNALIRQMEQIQKDPVDPEKLQATLADETLAQACDLKRGLEMVALLEAHMKDMNPNLDLISEYRRKVSSYNVQVEELNMVTQQRDDIKKQYDEWRKKMLDEFIEGFNAVSLKLKEMYQFQVIVYRTLWMTFALPVMLITFILFALAFNGILYAAIPLLGICYGILYAIMVQTVSELFGLKHFGLIYSFMGLGNPIAALLFSGMLAGYVYDEEAAKQGSSTRVGLDCFKVTFLVLASGCGLGSILSIILTVRIWPVYQMLYSGGSFRLPRTSGH